MKKEENQYKKYILKNIKHIEKYFDKKALDIVINDYIVLTKINQIFSMPYFLYVLDINTQIKRIVQHGKYFKAV